MKFETIKSRLRKDRPMTSVTIRMPQDVVEDLKQIAPRLGFSGYQPLIRAYVGKGLRADLARLDDDRISHLLENLRREGVSNEVLERALGSATNESPR